MQNVFHVGERVRFKDEVFKLNVSPLFEVYKDHEFVITGYLRDDDERPLKDHLFLHCLTGNVVLHGAVCGGDLERVRVVNVLIAPYDTSFDPGIAVDLVDAGAAFIPDSKPIAFEGKGGSFDGGGASGDWTDDIGDSVSSAFSTVIETTGSVLGGVGDTIGSIAEGVGDIAGGILGALD